MWVELQAKVGGALFPSVVDVIFQFLPENHGFNQIPLRTHSSSLEGATELKFAAYLDTLADCILFFRFRPETMDYNPWFRSDFSLHS